jgi:chaperonin GroEL
MNKLCLSSDSLQERLSKGVNDLADCVSVTLGPRGRNVMLRSGTGQPMITKDGVTVARFFSSDDPFEDAAASILKEVAENTNSLAGDGTTTSTVLAREMYNEAQKYIRGGHDPLEIKRGIEAAALEVIENIKENSIAVESYEDIENVATVSANNDKAIGKLIATAADQAGDNGLVTVREGQSDKTKLTMVEGFRFDSGYAARSFVTNERKNVVEYQDPLILVTDQKIEHVQQILPALEQVAREGKPFVLIADSIEGQALAALIMNTVRGTMKVAACKAPRFGKERRQILSDLALATGATFFTRSSATKLEEAKLSHFGQCKSIDIEKNSTIIVDGAGRWEDIEERMESLKSEVEQTEDFKEARVLQERVARLMSGIAIVEVGAPSEVEMIEKKHRIEDALEAVKSAQELGLVSGGGAALLLSNGVKVKTNTPTEQFGVEVLLKTLEAPMRQMAKNCGLSGDLVVSAVLTQSKRKKNNRLGYNFLQEKVVDMFDAGIVDPTKVTITALKNAVSVVTTLLTTSSCIIGVDKNES